MIPDDTEHAGMEQLLFTLLARHETPWPVQVVLADPDPDLESHATKSRSLGMVYWTGECFEIRIRPGRPFFDLLETLAHETAHILNGDVGIGRARPDLAVSAPLRAALAEDRLSDTLQEQGIGEDEAEQLGDKLTESYLIMEGRASRVGEKLFRKWLELITLMAEELKRVTP